MVFVEGEWVEGAGMLKRGRSTAYLLIKVLMLMYKLLAKMIEMFKVLRRNISDMRPSRCLCLVRAHNGF